MTIIVSQAGSVYNNGMLKQSIANRLGRNSLAAILPEFVMLAESRIYTGFRDLDVSVDPLRIRAMLATETQSLDSLPAGFLSIDRLSVTDSDGRVRPLTYQTPEVFNGACATSRPQFYTLQSGLVVIEGGTPAAFTLSYYKRFDALAADSDTNWLLQNAPQVYLYSALIEAYQHVKDDNRLLTAARQYAAAVNALIYADQAERHSGSTLVIGSPR